MGAVELDSRLWGVHSLCSLCAGLGRGTGAPEEMQGGQGLRGHHVFVGERVRTQEVLGDTCGLFMGPAEGSWVLPAEATAALPPSLGPRGRLGRETGPAPSVPGGAGGVAW